MPMSQMTVLYMYIYFYYITELIYHVLVITIGYQERDKSTTMINFTSFENVEQAFQRITSVVRRLLRVTDIGTIRAAVFLQCSGPSGIKLSDEVRHQLKNVTNTDQLIDELVYSNAWTWIDKRLMEGMAAASSLSETLQIVKDYKKFLYAKKISEILPNSPNLNTKRQYVDKIMIKLNMSADDVTVGELFNFKSVLETVILDINMGSLALDHLAEGCIEMHCYIPIHFLTHAYQSSIKSTHRFSDFHIRFLEFKGYLRIYSLQSTSQTCNSLSMFLPSTGMVIRYYT